MTKPWRSASSNSARHSSSFITARWDCPASRHRSAARVQVFSGGCRSAAVGRLAPPATPRLRRFDRTDWADDLAARRGSITVCAKANSASREPLTGSTWVSGSSCGSHSGARARRRSPGAAPACRGERIEREAVERHGERLRTNAGSDASARRCEGRSAARRFRRRAGGERAQLLERVGLEPGEERVQSGSRRPALLAMLRDTAW